MELLSDDNENTKNSALRTKTKELLSSFKVDSSHENPNDHGYMIQTSLPDNYPKSHVPDLDNSISQLGAPLKIYTTNTVGGSSHKKELKESRNKIISMQMASMIQSTFRKVHKNHIIPISPVIATWAYQTLR